MKLACSVVWVEPQSSGHQERKAKRMAQSKEDGFAHSRDRAEQAFHPPTLSALLPGVGQLEMSKRGDPQVRQRAVGRPLTPKSVWEFWGALVKGATRREALARP